MNEIKITARGCSSSTSCDESLTNMLTSPTCDTCTNDLCNNGSGLVKSTMFGSFLIICIGTLVSNKLF